MNKATIWTIAGSDCSGGAGIQADIHTAHALGVHACSVIAALTAQNSQKLTKIEFCSTELLSAQLEALSADLPPQAIKLGMIGSLDTLKSIMPFLERFAVPIVYDPVLFASVGGALHQGELRQFLLQHFLNKISVLTPNIPEAEWLLGRSIDSNTAMELAAQELQALGPKVVLLKGGHAVNQQHDAQDYWTDGKNCGWLSSPRQNTPHRHGTGCTFSSAIAACLAKGYELNESLVLAKAYINQAIRLGQPLGHGRGAVGHGGWPSAQKDFPVVTAHVNNHIEPMPFLSCGPEPLGFYPIVDSAQWVQRMLDCQVTTLQLRIKDLPKSQLIKEIKDSIALARQYQARLFINDYWQYALEYGAYGVHLGQEDIDTADCQSLQQAGLRLGISTHSYYEIARALAYKPSYIACGPIYHTNTKVMQAAPQGLQRLQAYCRMLDYPVVAIGGIKREQLDAVVRAGADGVAVITAISQATNPEEETAQWIKQTAGQPREDAACS